MCVTPLRVGSWIVLLHVCDTPHVNPLSQRNLAPETKDKTLAKLQREVEQLNRLADCEHIVKLQAKFEDDGFAYLVMEHCSGGDLDHLLDVSYCLIMLSSG